MNLRCGILGESGVWEGLLSQEGVPGGPVGPADLEVTEWSCVAVGRMLDGLETGALQSYLAHGGAVIGPARYLGPALGFSTRAESVRFLLDDREERPWFDLLDVELRGDIPREANTCRTDRSQHAVMAGEWRGGIVVALPFVMEPMLDRPAAAYRMFPAPQERLPYERVARRGAAALRALVHRSLEFVHHARGIPYVRLRPIPDAAPSLVGLRLDTDAATREQIDAFIALSESLEMPFSWFVDTGSHASWLSRFADVPGGDVHVHCFRHREFSSPEDAVADVNSARALLQEAGIPPAGFAAPYGTWNDAIAGAVRLAAPAFSSEFSAGYGGTPFFPRIDGRPVPVLQIPVHPVSPGSLRRVGTSASRMVRYYHDAAHRAILRGDPVLLYDHPIHQCAEVMGEVVRSLRSQGAVPMTFSQYAGWWRERLAVRESLGVQWEADRLRSRASASQVLLDVSTPQGSGMAIPGTDVALGDLKLRVSAAYGPIENVRRIRETDLRTSIGTWVAAMTRRWHQ